MGYYASLNGYIDYKDVLTEETYYKAKEVLSWAFNDVDGDLDLDGSTKYSFYSYDKYYEDEVIDALKEVTKLGAVQEGEIDCAGEDDTHWRFLYDGSHWVEQSGEIVYEDEGFIVVGE